jgi:thiosulfate reductase cytochrome b subunit
MTRVLVYGRFQRFWHWTQALLVIGLTLTGFEVHYPSLIALLGFAEAVQVHRILAWAFVILIAFAVFWHFTTGAWRQFVPTRRGLPAMVGYYLWGIFRGLPKPVHRTRTARLNPLQRLAYVGLKLLVIPVLVTSGFLYLYANELREAGWELLSLGTLGAVHTFAAFAMVSFLCGHVYLTTTGSTPLANLRGMLNGYEDLDEAEADEELTGLRPGRGGSDPA